MRRRQRAVSRSHVLSLRRTDRAITLEYPALILEPEDRPNTAAAERVQDELRPTQDREPGIVTKHGRDMTHLHPPLGAPTQEFDLAQWQVLALHDRRRAVVLRNVGYRDQ